MATEEDKKLIRQREVPPLSLNRGLSKFRLPFGYAIALACLLLVERPLLLPGVLLALTGIAIRLWAAGSIIKKKELATRGPYSLTRNPLYLGSFLLGVGSVIAVRAWWLIPIYIVGFVLFYVPTIAKEERYLTELYGSEYLRYRMRVPAFFPWKLRFARGEFSITDLLVNREHIHAAVYLAFLILLQVIGCVRASGS